MVGQDRDHKSSAAAAAAVVVVSVRSHSANFPSPLATFSPPVGWLLPFSASQFHVAVASQSAVAIPSQNVGHLHSAAAVVVVVAAVAATAVGRQPAAALRHVADGQS